VAVVAESSDDLSMVFRTYCSQWPVDGRRHLRPPILGVYERGPDGLLTAVRVYDDVEPPAGHA
jgi:hypothetical protein